MKVLFLHWGWGKHGEKRVGVWSWDSIIYSHFYGWFLSFVKPFSVSSLLFAYFPVSFCLCTNCQSYKLSLGPKGFHKLSWWQQSWLGGMWHEECTSWFILLKCLWCNCENAKKCRNMMLLPWFQSLKMCLLRF